MTRITLKRGNDQVVTLAGLKATGGAYLNEAEVKATLRDSKDKPIPAFIDCPMEYVPESNGNYEWAIESSTMMLPKGVEYSLVVTAVQENLNYRVVHPVSVVDAEVMVTGSVHSSGSQGPQGPTGPAGPPGPPGPPGASIFAYSTSTNSQQAQDPGAGKIRWNNVVQQDSTSFYVDWLTADDFDAHLFFELTPPAARIVIQDPDLANTHQQWKVLGVVPNVDWFEVRVEFISQSGPGGVCTFTNNKRVMVLVLGS